MIDLDDIRQDIFDIKTVPKVLYVYRGDTFEIGLDLTISSSELSSVVLNCDGLPEATPLTLLETTNVSSKWHLVLNKTQTLILAPKNHNFTITIVRTDGTELTLYKGIMTVNNRVYSNYSNNYYVAVLLKQTVPTIADNDYLIGTIWVNVLTNRVYFLTSVVNDEANWLDYSDQLDTLRNDLTELDEKADTHIEDLNNPHEVTAEQVDTYIKTVIDAKDADTLQQAKDYTYSKVEIDNKDAAMVESGYYDEAANEIVLLLVNSSEIRIPVGNLLTDLDAHNIRFNGSGTNYLTDKTEVESALKELDTRVKTNADDIVLKGSTNDFTDVYKAKLDEMIAFMGFIHIDGGMFTTTPTISVSGGNFVDFELQGIIEGGNFI